MKNFSVQDRVVKTLEDIALQGHEILPNSTWEEMGLDSLDKVEVMMDLEDEFGIEIPDEVMSYLDNVEEIVEYITRTLRAPK